MRKPFSIFSITNSPITLSEAFSCTLRHFSLASSFPVPAPPPPPLKIFTSLPSTPFFHPLLYRRGILCIDGGGPILRILQSFENIMRFARKEVQKGWESRLFFTSSILLYSTYSTRRFDIRERKVCREPTFATCAKAPTFSCFNVLLQDPYRPIASCSELSEA